MHPGRPSFCAALNDLFLDTIADLFLATIADLFLATIAGLFLATLADLFRAASRPSSHRRFNTQVAGRFKAQLVGANGLLTGCHGPASRNIAVFASQNTVGPVSGNTIAPLARVQASVQSTLQTFELSAVLTFEQSTRAGARALGRADVMALVSLQSYRCSRIDAGALVFVSLQTPGHPGSVWNNSLSGCRFVENGDLPSAIELARLVRACARACIGLDDFDFIFEDLFGHYDDAGIRRIFLRELEPFLLEGEIKDHAAGRSLACS
ncbi:hypothetical protein GGG16DRAFT_110960 [Schizophyllum commune]